MVSLIVGSPLATTLSTGFPLFIDFLEMTLTFVCLEVIYGIVIASLVIVFGDGAVEITKDGYGRVILSGDAVISKNGG